MAEKAKKSAKKTVKRKAKKSKAPGRLLKDTAYEAIKDHILSNGLMPGSFMSIGEVAGWFKMSKTPVREAFQRLESEGFVTISPQQGIAVRGVSLDEIMELFDIRSLLEGHIAKRLAGQLSSQQIEELNLNIAKQEAACKKNNAEDLVRLDREFHSLLYQYNGNKQIESLLTTARDKIFSVLGPLYGKMDDLNPVVDQHRSIVDTLCGGVRQEASKKTREHLKYWQKLALYERFSSLEEEDELD